MICVDDTPAIRWEIEHIRVSGIINKTLFLLPPKASGANENRAFCTKVLDQLGYAASADARAAFEQGGVIGFFQDESGAMRVGQSTTFSRDAYFAMLRLFLRTKHGMEIVPIGRSGGYWSETTSAKLDRATQRLGWLPPLLLRVVLGVTFILTGWRKFHNLENVAEFFAFLGLPAARIQAPFVAAVELIGGILILAGLATRIAAMFLMAVMTVAIAMAIWPEHTVTEVIGSIEAVYLVGFIYLAINGASAVSLDRLAAGEHERGN